MKKILFVLDINNEQKLEFLKKTISESFDSYKVVFKIYNNTKENLEYYSNNIQDTVDFDAINTQIDEYECVIVYGLISYFWLKSFYCKNMIIINPILDIYEDFYDIDKKYYEDLKYIRDVNVENTICLISNEYKDNIRNIDNILYNTTVVIAKENIREIKKFFNNSSTLKQLLLFLKKYE